ncbi:unnamed protein product [Coffea canephora]|uniref:Plant bHLH transcription factor ACT-like domain-containing protein n=2 Tax=Coffea TaxID=13442 RepID=A0A068TKM6_COFCA|nr:uncharacterized protein LOC113757696 [Coffea eugenioides]CDO96850.1 unnamed protein product [Coffea canephora]
MVPSRVSREQRRIALRRKLHILRKLTNSKSVKKSSIIMDAFLYIYKLKLQLEAIRREYQNLINHIQEVKVEKFGTKFLVRVTCKKGKDLLVSIIEAFENLNLNIFQAKAACKHFFFMEAVVEDEDQVLDVKDVTEAVMTAIQK